MVSHQQLKGCLITARDATRELGIIHHRIGPKGQRGQYDLRQGPGTDD
jgi:hypothetical protein